MAAPQEVQEVQEDLMDQFLLLALRLLEHPWDQQDLQVRGDLEGHPHPSYLEGLVDQVLLSRPGVLLVLSCQVLLSRPCRLLFQLNPSLLGDP